MEPFVHKMTGKAGLVVDVRFYDSAGKLCGYERMSASRAWAYIDTRLRNGSVAGAQVTPYDSEEGGVR